jgi:hypothetical protein
VIAARRGIAAVVAAVALSAGLAACSSSTTPEQANAAFCTDVTALQAQTAKLQAMVIQGSSTLSDVQAQGAEVAKAFDQTKESASDVAGNTAAELQAADKAFDDAIDAIPSDATVEQAKAAYTAALVQYTAAVASAKSDVGC